MGCLAAGQLSMHVASNTLGNHAKIHTCINEILCNVPTPVHPSTYVTHCTYCT